MCEHCDVFKTWGVPLPDEAKAGCERKAVQPYERWTCDQEATWRVYVRRADGHRCSMHRTAENKRIDDVGGSVGPFGVQGSVEFLPIDETAMCDHVDEEDIQRHCDRPASHVKMVTEQWPRCDEHAALVGFKLV